MFGAQVGVRFQSLVPGWGSLSLVVRGLGLACSVGLVLGGAVESPPACQGSCAAGS
jgi:hypothetical protein